MGGTGGPPVPLGGPPDGTERYPRTEIALLQACVLVVPLDGSPSEAGGVARATQRVYFLWRNERVTLRSRPTHS